MIPNEKDTKNNAKIEVETIHAFMYKSLVSHKQLLDIIDKYNLQIVRPIVDETHPIQIAPNMVYYSIDLVNGVLFDTYDLLKSNIEFIPINIMDVVDKQSMTQMLLDEGISCVYVMDREYMFPKKIIFNEENRHKQKLVKFLQHYHCMLSSEYFNYNNADIRDMIMAVKTVGIDNIDYDFRLPIISENMVQCGIDYLHRQFLLGHDEVEYLI